MTRSEFLPFSRPSIDERDIEAVVDVMRSGWLTTGSKCAEFERSFAACVGASGAVGLCSATAGMHLTLLALGIGQGDEVVTSSLTWVSTVNMIKLVGATPVFADVDRDTLLMTEATIAACITERTKCIVPVHFAGAPVDLVPIRRLAASRGISLIEDAAHAVGTEYRGETIGACGTSIFSFHPIKNITTGEGGMVCSDDPDFLDRIRRLKFHGLGVDAYDRRTQGRSPQAEVIEPGFKYNLTDIAAALGIEQLKRLDAFNLRREQLAGLYREQLAEIEEILPLGDPPHDTKHAWHLFIVRLDIDKAGISRDSFMAELKRRNIGTGLHFRAVHTQKFYRETMDLPSGTLPNTDWNSDRILSLPLFPDMADADVRDVVDAIKDVLAQKGGQ